MTDGVVPNTDGFELIIKSEEMEEINKRAMNDESDIDDGKHFMIPPSRTLDLLFFRMIYHHMLVEETGKESDSITTKEEEAGVPVSAFQRTLERMFFVLRDPKGFDARDFDVDGNGRVGWNEFVDVFRQREVVIHLSIMERIFMTLSDPESCWLAQGASVFVLMVIATSSVCFMLGTMFQFQQEPEGDLPPEPFPIFGHVEMACLAIFVVEYLARLLTCWSVREEVIDQKQLMALTIGYEAIRRSTPLSRIIGFIFEPANLIDLAAILPGVIGALPGVVIDGGGFVVLRLIRLTRVFRAPAIREPAQVIAKTIKRSTKALGILVFNLMLGIVIFGSLMYLCERGKWDPENRKYMRPLDGVRTWDQNTSTYTVEQEESPFVSIPHSFWWAIVTATTVGYGDHYPTTSIGFVIATLNMMFSLVMTALPVGVIGGTFANVWDEVHQKKDEEIISKKKQISTIKASKQRFKPFDTMSKLMLIDVWNDRFKKEGKKAFVDGPDGLVELDAPRPLKGDFMGSAKIELDLHPLKATSATKEVKLQPDYDTVQREVTGMIVVKYQWTPTLQPKVEGSDGVNNAAEGGSQDRLVGQLYVSIISGHGLLNVNLGNPSQPSSNPYCQVLCYPKPPAFQRALVEPCIWRTPSSETCNPEWNFNHSFQYAWMSTPQNRQTKPDWDAKQGSRTNASQLSLPP